MDINNETADMIPAAMQVLLFKKTNENPQSIAESTKAIIINTIANAEKNGIEESAAKDSPITERTNDAMLNVIVKIGMIFFILSV